MIEGEECISPALTLKDRYGEYGMVCFQRGVQGEFSTSAGR